MCISFQIGGIRRRRKEAVNPHVFHKLPGRLAFNLHNLVDYTTLQDGCVHHIALVHVVNISGYHIARIFLIVALAVTVGVLLCID